MPSRSIASSIICSSGWPKCQPPNRTRAAVVHAPKHAGQSSPIRAVLNRSVDRGQPSLRSLLSTSPGWLWAKTCAQGSRAKSSHPQKPLVDPDQKLDPHDTSMIGAVRDRLEIDTPFYEALCEVPSPARCLGPYLPSSAFVHRLKTLKAPEELAAPHASRLSFPDCRFPGRLFRSGKSLCCAQYSLVRHRNSRPVFPASQEPHKNLTVMFRELWRNRLSDHCPHVRRPPFFERITPFEVSGQSLKMSTLQRAQKPILRWMQGYVTAHMPTRGGDCCCGRIGPHPLIARRSKAVNQPPPTVLLNNRTRKWGIALCALGILGAGNSAALQAVIVFPGSTA